MTPVELQDYFYKHIPLTRALAVEVLEVSEARVAVGAPLAPNLNHRQTAFGGSVASVAILAGWGWLHARLADLALDGRVVIQKQEMDYVAPIDAALTATCVAPGALAWALFARALKSRGRARIELHVKVTCRELLAARFVGTYVALRGGSSASG